MYAVFVCVPREGNTFLLIIIVSITGKFVQKLIKSN